MSARRRKLPSGRPLALVICTAALLLLCGVGCGARGGGDSTAEDQVHTGTGEATVTVGSTGQGARIEVAPRHSDQPDHHPQKRLDRDAEKPEEHAAEGRATSAPAHKDTPTGVAAFETKGGDNSIQQFGSEAAPSDFEQAAAALHGYLDARATGDWRSACSNLAAAISTQLAQLSGGRGGPQGCPELLASISAASPPALRAQTAEADVAAFRVEGERGFLLYHGAEDVDYFMPMAREDGIWKVAAIAPSALG